MQLRQAVQMPVTVQRRPCWRRRRRRSDSSGASHARCRPRVRFGMTRASCDVHSWRAPVCHSTSAKSPQWRQTLPYVHAASLPALHCPALQRTRRRSASRRWWRQSWSTALNWQVSREPDRWRGCLCMPKASGALCRQGSLPCAAFHLFVRGGKRAGGCTLLCLGCARGLWGAVREAALHAVVAAASCSGRRRGRSGQRRRRRSSAWRH